MGLIWPLAATGNLSNSSVLVAWTYSYVTLRALYIVLEIKYGVAFDGLNKPLWISTFPSYNLFELLACAKHPDSILVMLVGDLISLHTVAWRTNKMPL